MSSYWEMCWLIRTALDQHPFTRSVNISSSYDFRFSGAGERKACRRCLDLMTTLVNAVLPTSWHITVSQNTNMNITKKTLSFSGKWLWNPIKVPLYFLAYLKIPGMKFLLWGFERESKCCSLTADVLADSLSMCRVSLPVLEEEGFTPDLSNGIKNDCFFTDVHGGNWTLSWRQGFACRDPWGWEIGAHQTHTHPCSNFSFNSCYLIADSLCCVHVSHHPTIELLDALDVIVRKSEVFGEGVNGGHQSSGVLRVLQTKGMAELMSCHQEQTVTYKTHKEMAIPSQWPILALLYNYLSSVNNQRTLIMEDVTFTRKIEKMDKLNFKKELQPMSRRVSVLSALVSTNSLHLDRDRSPICGRHHSSWW